MSPRCSSRPGRSRPGSPTGALLVALSILPALPIIGVIGVIGLYLVEETDEYLRTRVVQAMLVGLGFMLAVASAWGFMEEGGVVPHVPAYWAFILWCAAWGVAQCVQGLRERMRATRVNNRLRDLRAERGWSQQQLADALEVSRQSVNAIETGRYDPSLPLAFNIADLFGRAIEDIFVNPAKDTDQ